MSQLFKLYKGYVGLSQIWVKLIKKMMVGRAKNLLCLPLPFPIITKTYIVFFCPVLT